MEYLDEQDLWEKVVDKACADYDTLTREERVWFNIRGLIDAVNDGGMISFYYNHGADYMDETLEDLKSLKANKAVKLVQKVNGIFPNGMPPKSIEERNAVIESSNEGQYDALLEEVDDAFYSLEDALEAKLEPIIAKIMRENA